MRCWVGKPGDSRRFTVYTAKWCGACKTQVPMIQDLARRNGFEVELVDVDDLGVQKRVQHVRFVPYIEYLGLEIGYDEFLEVIRGRAEGEGSG